MARLTPEERQHKSALHSHLYQMHGHFRVHNGGALTLEQLERLHEVFHLDDYMCPPHEHEEHYDLEIGNIVYQLGRGYPERAVERSRK